jgi:plastocyanin
VSRSRSPFSNADAAIPHNVTISTAGGATRFSGQIVSGVASVTYAVPALPAGDYRLSCIVHPAMSGTLSVS